MSKVTITFELAEDVTPTYFAGRVAIGLGYGTMRVGEALVCDGTRFVITERDEVHIGKSKILVPSYREEPA